MNRTHRTTRLVFAVAAVAITGLLFQSVASFSRPTAIEQLALAQKSAVTVASLAAPAASGSAAGAR